MDDPEEIACSIPDCGQKVCDTLLSADDIELLKFRAKHDLGSEGLCQKHYDSYLKNYVKLQKHCCNPFKSHRKLCNPRFTLDIKFVKSVLQKPSASGLKDLIPGKKVCNNCMISLRKLCENQDEDDEYVCSAAPGPSAVYVSAIRTEKANELIANINSISDSNISPVKNHGLSDHRKLSVKKRKLDVIFSKANDIFDESLSIAADSEGSLSSISNMDKIKMFDDLMNSVEKKLSQVDLSRSEKVQILTMIPEDFSRKFVVENFDVSDRMVRQSRSLGFLELPKSTQGRPFSEQTANLIVMFYQDDEYSRLLPGKKDCVSVIHGKEKMQKRLLLLPVEQLYKAFKEKYRDDESVKVGLSKFYSLRPKWCIPAGASGTHSVCCCTIHENIKLLCDCLPSGVTYKDLVQLATCDSSNRDCMLLKCDDCPDKNSIKDFLITQFPDYEEEGEDDATVTFKRWVAVDRADLITQTLPVLEFIDLLLTELYKLLPHSFIATKQGQYFKERKESLKVGEVLVNMDFAENYSYVIQNEIQGYHWTSNSCTVHPVVCYFKQKNAHGQFELTHQSFCFLSDELDHGVPMVYAIQRKVVALLKDLVDDDLVLVEYITDGCAGQYKNFKSFSNVVYHESDHGVPCIWTFFATSHGKSACDGIGGNIKRCTAKESLRRPAANAILNANDMAEYCKETFPTIIIELVTSGDIESAGAMIEQRVASSSTLNGTRGFHSFEHVGGGKIGAKIISSDKRFELVVDHCPILRSNLSDFHLQNYVAFVYDRKWYIGIITEIDKEMCELKINSMHPPGPALSFIWPTRLDSVWVPLPTILIKIDCPTLFPSRGSYKISIDNERKIIEQWNMYASQQA